MECEHYGHIAVCDSAGKILAEWGDPLLPTYMRSSAKPFQAITCLQTGAMQAYQWTDAELALICASHGAEPVHLETVRSILAKAELPESALQCGPHLPTNDACRNAMIRTGERPTQIHSNCSGKHSGMIATCKHAGWPIETYLQPGHPLQQANVATFARFAGLKKEEVLTGLDGCGVPTFLISTAAMATAFARLTNPANLESRDKEAAVPVARAMAAYPVHIAGTGQFNTQLGEFCKSAVVAKGGAEGVFCIGLPGKNIGIAIKTSDGSARPHPTIVIRLLQDYLSDLDWNSFDKIANPAITNTRSEETGAIEAAF